MKTRGFLALIGVVVVVLTTQTRAGVNYSTSVDAPAFDPGWAIASPLSGIVLGVSQTNQQVNAGTSYAQTFVTGPDSLPLDKIVIYSGGKAGGDVKLNIYPAPVGGGDGDGFVNTSFSTDLLNGGAGLTFTAFGSGGLQYITLDLTGADEITLAPNTKYAIEMDVLSGQFSWQRSNQGEYPSGNLYVAGSSQAFVGTPTSDARGERYALSGSPQRDGFFALYAVPEPGSFSLMAIAGATMLARRRRCA